MDSNLLGTDVADMLSTVLHESTGDLLVVDPTRSTLEALIEVASDADRSPPALRVLAAESTLKSTLADFLLGSRAADLIEAGTLSIRTLTSHPTNSLLLTDETVLATVTAGDRIAGLTTADAAFVSSAREHYEARWDAADRYGLRTPPLSRVRSTLADEIGPATRGDFDAVLDSLETARGDGEGLDEVTISLLVAARNEVLLYDISKWGEDVGIASKATFSRTKTRLEEAGLITTEKVPIDVGRPRLRLTLGEGRLATADIEEFAAVAGDLLA